MSSQPPFSALRALEAAARHRSFTGAARELRITHSAVSQAVRRLEADIGTRLFDRRGGAMEPSEAALKLAQSYSSAADQLTELICEIRGDDYASRLAVRMPPDVARLWMPGRETRLTEAMPDVEVAITAGDVRGGGEDVELLATPKPRPGDQLLAPVVATPLAAPALVEAQTTLDPSEVTKLPLLAEKSDRWSAWLAKYAPGIRSRPKVIRDRQAMLDAARSGQGVVLADQLEAHAHLAGGELRPLPFPVEEGQWLALRSHAAPALAGAVERLAMWLKLELARDAALGRKLAPAR